MKNVIYILLIMVLFSISGILKAQLPDSDAIYESLLEEFTIHEDGTTDHHVYKRMKYLTHTSFNRYFGETFIVYNPYYQELKINLSQTTQNNGQRILTPDNAFNEVLPGFAADAYHYNHLREMVVTHTGLEVGATVELDYNIKSKQAYYPGMAKQLVLPKEVPVDEYIVQIILPKYYNLSYKVSNIRTAPIIIDEEDKLIYKFVFRNLQPLVHESFSPPAELFAPVLSFSFNTPSEWYEKVTAQDAFAYDLNKNLKHKVDERKKNAKNDLELILAIQDMVMNEVNHIAVPLQFSDLLSSVTADVYENNAGTSFEKSMLMTALLRYAGINAYPALIFDQNQQENDPIALEKIQDFLVQINPRDEKQMYLSALHSDQNNQLFSLVGKKVLVLDRQKAMQYLEFKSDKNIVNLSGSLELSDSLTMEGVVSLELGLECNPYFQLAKSEAKAGKILTGISADDIAEIDLKENSQVESKIQYTLSGVSKPKEVSGYYFLDLPSVTTGIDSWHMTYLNSERKNTLEVPFPISESYEWEVKLPHNLQLVNTMEAIKVKNDVGSIFIDFSQKGNELKIFRSLEISKRMIDVLQYSDFKELIDTWNLEKFNQLIFKYTD